VTTQTAERVAAILGSGSFVRDDPFSFKVPLSDTDGLPGKYDPAEYLNHLELPNKPERVLVVGAANGGLTAALVRSGCLDVAMVEPRVRYRKTLGLVISTLAQAHKGLQAQVCPIWPTKPEHAASLGQFDLILWADGLASCQMPGQTLALLLTLLKPEGRMFVEVLCGNDSAPSPQHDGWAPSEGAFLQFMQRLAGKAPTKLSPQRAENMGIFEIHCEGAPKDYNGVDMRSESVKPLEGTGSSRKVDEPNPHDAKIPVAAEIAPVAPRQEVEVAVEESAPVADPRAETKEHKLVDMAPAAKEPEEPEESKDPEKAAEAPAEPEPEAKEETPEAAPESAPKPKAKGGKSKAVKVKRDKAADPE